MTQWLLPEGIEEVLPPEAEALDRLCRQVLDLFRAWGYELVMPPLVEYLEALLTGTGEDLDLQTFKVTDQLSGRTLGIRADTTPQVARIDAHYLRRETPTRLCYVGPALHTRAGGQGGTRAPLQAGVELFGHAGRDSEVEIISLMLRTLEQARVRNVHVDLGHVGIYRGLTARLGLAPDQEVLLFQNLQKKSTSELREQVASWSIAADDVNMLLALAGLHGGHEILALARRKLAGAGAEVVQAIDALDQVAERVWQRHRQAPIFFDLAELRGYQYYTGLTFAAYVPGQGQGIAFGGRYDGIGAAFGRPRPATGFSTDLKTLHTLVAPPPPARRRAIFAPYSEVPGLFDFVENLRGRGEIVICELPGQAGDARALDCDRELVLERGKWRVRKLPGG